jgi:hypothetical protein
VEANFPSKERVIELDNMSSFFSRVGAQIKSSWASVVISFCALLLSLYSACETRKVTHLSARPYIQLSFYYKEQGAGWTFRNMGLGPAIVHSFEVSLDGQPLRNWNELQSKLGLSNNIKFSVAAPGNMSVPYKTGDESEILFWDMEPSDNKKLTANSTRVRIMTCYCSLYNECWKSRYSIEQADSMPEEVSSCKVIPAEERFGAVIPKQ